MLSKRPYFLENKDWYYVDEKKNKFFLTDKAPEKARKSYEEFYNPPYHYDFFDYQILKEEKEYMYKRLISEGKTPEEAKKISDDWWNDTLAGK